MSAIAQPSDSRFDRIATDPRFKSIPKRARKVKIDSRFQSMFDDEKFKVKYSVDKRGRRVNLTSSEDLRKYYDLDDGDKVPRKKHKTDDLSTEKDDTSFASESKHESSPLCAEPEADSTSVSDAEVVNTQQGSDVSSEEEEEEEEEKEVEEGDDQSSTTSTDIETLGDEQLDEGIVHSWGDLEGDVPRSEAIGRRLAVCSMDWDRVSAQDLFLLFNSFKPQGGCVTSVTIYPSDYGLERMEKEEQSGPLELVEHEDQNEEEEYSKEKLRQYQMNRLKYYYAVMECDSKATAEHIYTNCDGMEYEHSANKFDIRYIPDDMTFDDRKPKSVATESTIPAGFTPSDFFTSALQQSKVQLTWDETDPQRVKTTMRKFTEDEVLKEDFDAYLASSTDEDEDEVEKDKETKTPITEDEKIKKYRALLDEIKDKAEEDCDMEITWEPGLKETAESLVEKKLVEKQVGKLSAWQRHVQEKKERKKELREKRKGGSAVKEALEKQSDTHATDENGFNDPFFQQDNDSVPVQASGIKKTKKSREKKFDSQQQNELELLVQDDDHGKRHFSLKGILQQEKGGKKKRRQKGGPEPEPDTFQIDLNDPRFSALYESHLYAVDPSDSHYKPTNAMKAVMQERLKRRRQKEKTGY